MYFLYCHILLRQYKRLAKNCTLTKIINVDHIYLLTFILKDESHLKKYIYTERQTLLKITLIIKKSS